jgi:hypothetical protein
MKLILEFNKLRRILGRMKEWEVGESCIMRSFKMCALHQI